jgi:hypothetical protein
VAQLRRTWKRSPVPHRRLRAVSERCATSHFTRAKFVASRDSVGYREGMGHSRGWLEKGAKFPYVHKLSGTAPFI